MQKAKDVHNTRISLFGREILNIQRKGTGFPSLQEAIKHIMDSRGQENITEDNAYRRHVWVYSCITSIAKNIARVPFKLYNGDKEITSGPVYKLFRTVNPYMNSYQLWEGTETFLHFKGETFWLILKAGNTPFEISLLTPSSMKEKMAGGNLIGWEYQTGAGKRLFFTPDEIIQFKFFNPYNAIRGLSPLKAAMDSIDIDDYARRFDKSILKNGSTPGGVIETDNQLDDSQFERLRKEWEKRHQGVDAAGNVAILENGLKYKETKLTPEEIKYIEQRKMSREEVASIFKVPPIELGLFEDANYNNARQQIKMFWTKKLIPEMMYVQDVLKTNFFDVYFPGIEGRFDLNEIQEIQEEAEQKASRDREDVKSGLMTINEVRESNNREPVPWGNTWWIPYSQVPAGTELPQKEAPKKDDEKDKFVNVLDTINSIEKKEIDIKEKRRFAIWKSFIKQIQPVTNKYQSKLSRYFFELRQEILENFFDYVKTYKKIEIKQDGPQFFNFGEQYKKLMILSEPFFEEAIKQGGNSVLIDIGLEPDFGIVNQDTIRFLNSRKLELKNIPETVSTQIKDVLSAGIEEGLTSDKLADKIRHVMDMAANRSKLIARTEITGCANGGRFYALQENGIEKHEWIQSYDSDVREEHRIFEIVVLGKEFSNGLRYPGDRGGSGSNAANICNCYDKNTEVLTEDGFKFFDKLNKKEKIATLNPETKQLVYLKPKKYIKYKYKGEMIYYKHRNMDLVVTKKHKMPCIRKWDNYKKRENITFKDAENLLSGDVLLRNAKWEGVDKNNIKIMDKEYNTELFVKFFGWYLAEGSVTNVENSSKKRIFKYQISIHQNKGDNFNEIKEVCQKLFTRVWIGKNKIYVIDDNLGLYLINLGKSWEKYIPAEIKKLNKKYLKIFLDAFCKGDGHKLKANRYNKNFDVIFKKEKRFFFTSSKKLADDIGELILKIGKVPRFSFPQKKDYKNIKFKNGTYKIKHPVIRITEIYLLRYSHLKKYENKIKYNDYVFCVEMPINHTLYVRRNGHCIWCGNCRCTTAGVIEEANQ